MAGARSVREGTARTGAAPFVLCRLCLDRFTAGAPRRRDPLAGAEQQRNAGRGLYDAPLPVLMPPACSVREFADDHDQHTTPTIFRPRREEDVPSAGGVTRGRTCKRKEASYLLVVDKRRLYLRKKMEPKREPRALRKKNGATGEERKMEAGQGNRDGGEMGPGGKKKRARGGGDGMLGGRQQQPEQQQLGVCSGAKTRGGGSSRVKNSAGSLGGERGDAAQPEQRWAGVRAGRGMQ